MVEMSKHSIRLGMAGNASVVAQRFERVVLRQARVDEPRLIGHPRVAIGQLDEPALFAALRHEHLHPAAGPLRQPRLQQFAILRRARQMHFRGRGAIFVKLLDRGLKNFRGGARQPLRWPPARPARAPARRASGTRARRRPPAPCAARTHRGRPASPSPFSAAGPSASGRCARRRADGRPPRTAPRPPPPSSTR